MTYHIIEVFPSVQGEGANAGVPVIFVRFAGCSHKCHFCDTDFITGAYPMEVDELVELIDDHHIPRVIFTGGEPSLQLDAELVSRLRDLGIWTGIETNGYFDVSGLGLDWITVSPKNRTGGPIEPDKFVQRTGNELRVLFPDAFNDLLFLNTELQFDHYCLSPCISGGVNYDVNGAVSQMHIERAFDFVKSNPRWRLSLQLHKFIGVR